MTGPPTTSNASEERRCDRCGRALAPHERECEGCSLATVTGGRGGRRLSRAALLFGVVAATIEMAVVLWLLYGR